MASTFIRISLCICGLFFCVVSGRSTPADSARLASADTMSQWPMAVKIYDEVYNNALASADKALVSQAISGKARRMVAQGMLDSAQQAAELAIRLCNTGKADNIEVFYNIKAAALHYTNQLDSATTYYIKALNIYEQKNDSLKAATIRFNVGNLFLSHRNYVKAHEQFLFMHTTLLRYKDSTYLARVLAALSATEQEIGTLQQSEQYAKDALQIASARGDVMGILLAQRQLGQLANTNGRFEEAIDYFRQAKVIAEKVNMPYYLALIHLGNAEAYEGLSNYTKAIEEGKSALQYAQTSGFGSYLGTLYRTLSQAYAKTQQYPEAYNYSLAYNRFQDSVGSAENKEIVNDLLLKYESAQKDKKLTEQALSLQKQRNQLQLYVGLFLFLAAVGVFVTMIRQRNRRQHTALMEREKERQIMQSLLQGEEKERKRISGELHDHFSNGLYQCKLLLTQPEAGENEVLQIARERIDRLMQDSRNLAHQMAPLQVQQLGLIGVLQKHVDYLNNLPIPTRFFARLPELETNLPFNTEAKLMIYRAVQELTANIIKHANATEADVQMVIANNVLSISIEDNGAGFDVATNYNKGTGLASIQERLALIGATIEWDAAPGKGTSVQIHLPFNTSTA